MNVDAVGLNGLLLRLLIATLVGGIPGSNRELHHKAAGVRTHALVSLGAACDGLGHGSSLQRAGNHSG